MNLLFILTIYCLIEVIVIIIIFNIENKYIIIKLHLTKEIIKLKKKVNWKFLKEIIIVNVRIVPFYDLARSLFCISIFSSELHLNKQIFYFLIEKHKSFTIEVWFHSLYIFKFLVVQLLAYNMHLLWVITTLCSVYALFTGIARGCYML